MTEQQPPTEWEQIVNVARNLKRWGYALSAAGEAVLKVDRQDETDMAPEEFWGFNQRNVRLIEYLAEKAKKPWPEDVEEGVKAAIDWLNDQDE